MNLINCNENCVHQRDGICKMGTTAPINAVKVNGCSYFHSKKIKNTTKPKKLHQCHWHNDLQDL